MKTILIIIAYVHGGAHVHSVEFNSLEQCQYAAKLVKESSRIHSTQCVYKDTPGRFR